MTKTVAMVTKIKLKYNQIKHLSWSTKITKFKIRN